MKLTISISAVALALTACAQTPPAPLPPERTKASLFTVPEAKRGRLQVLTLVDTPIRPALSVPASVAFDDLKTSTVMPLVSGKVEKVLVHEGDRVKAGQPLLVIASPDASDTAANLVRDQATLTNKQAVLRRDRDLYEHKAISQEELESAQLDVTSAQASVADDLAHAKIIGGGKRADVLRAPVSGLVVSRQVSAGNAVSAGATPCFVITDPTALWVIAQLYQDDVGRVSRGDGVTVTSPVLTAPLKGQVAYIGAGIDPDTHTIPVRIEVSNPGGLLKAGMYVSARIQPSQAQRGLVVPHAAVLRDDDNLPFVYVQTTPGTFARRHVELGSPVDDGQVIAGGVKPGEQVLASGAVFVQFADSLEQ